MSERKTSPTARALGLLAMAAVLATPACNNDPVPAAGNERWVTSQDTTVEIDWDAVGKAYREAEGPEDFEQKVNEIYTGSEVISVAVTDLDDKTQEVVGFFDGDGDGKVTEPEKVFTIKRDITGPEAAQVQVAGHGAYASYRSPIWDIATGMLMGSMLSRALSPGYVPAYSQSYVTSPARRDALVSHRDGYRQSNPDKFRSGKSSKSGRSYGAKGNNFGGGKPSSSSTPSPSRSTPTSRPRSFGGGRFGRTGPPRGRVVRLVS
ncbi:MAG: hypothetical protein AB1Z98_21510 [Nannocystaceae bacterium]